MDKLKPCPFCGAKEPVVTLVKANSFSAVICSIWSGGCGITTSTYATAKDAIKAWNNRASGWIPCSERLPNMFETVLVAYKDCDGELVYAISERFQFVGKKRIRWSAIAGNTPSHWMPLPEPPEYKENENRNENERY